MVGRWMSCQNQELPPFRPLSHQPARHILETRFTRAMGGVKPTLFIHKRCGRLLETLPALQPDPNRPENVLKVDCGEAGIGGDDAADALRYLLRYLWQRSRERSLNEG